MLVSCRRHASSTANEWPRWRWVRRGPRSLGDPRDCGWGVPWPQVPRTDTRTLRGSQHAFPQCPDKLSVLDQAGNERALRGRNLGNDSASIYARNNERPVTRCFHLGRCSFETTRRRCEIVARTAYPHAKPKRYTTSSQIRSDIGLKLQNTGCWEPQARLKQRGARAWGPEAASGVGMLLLAASAQTQHRWAAGSIAIED